jgi:DNA-binding LytR/AlgR family response regulator
MRIAVCETQAEYIDYICKLLKQIREVSFATVATYTDPEWMISDVLLRTEAFDIAIISRELGTHNGVFIAREIVKKNASCQIVLISEKNRILPEYYEMNHACILPKEFVPLYLVTAIQKSVVNLSSMEHSFFVVASNSEKIFVPCRDVLYLERIQRKTHIVTKDDTIETYQLPQDIIGSVRGLDFVQCHRSIFVNLRKVTRYQANEFTLEQNIKLPIGRQYALQMKEALRRFESGLMIRG